MRVDRSSPILAQAGDLIVIRLRLPSGATQARMTVWSRVPGWDFAPHTQNYQTDVLKDGRPQFVSPMYRHLHEQKREATIEFTADEKLEFVVRQEVDLVAEATAIVRIKRYGTFAQAVRRRLRNAIRALRDRSALRFGPARR
jgi:hypothetical protein